MKLKQLTATLSEQRSNHKLSVHSVNFQPPQQPQKDTELDFCDFFNQYENIRKYFKINYHQSLRWSLQSYLFVLVLYLWKNTYYLIYESEWTYLMLFGANIMNVGIFVVTATLMTETFETFKTKLYDHGLKFIGQDTNCTDRLDYQYLLSHILNKPIVVTAGKFAVTKQNVLKFMVGFASAKFMAYIVRILYPNLF